jgi:NAD(P)-dependent dehydrogenase (short-subunit alcohol dehydrogenase family)
VVINGHRDMLTAQAVADEARALGVGALAIRADMGDPDDVTAMANQALDAFGSVDIAVSNAAQRLRQSFLSISVADWNSVLSTNLSASFYLARAVLPSMIAKKWGRIIHISGCEGFTPVRDQAHKVACKAGIVGLAKAIALEFGEHGITANSVAPGVIETQRDPMADPGLASRRAGHRQQLPVQRLGTVDDVAQACLYLCSDQAGFVTGQVLHVNGGELML